MKPLILSVRYFLVFTVLTGILYPLSITFLGKLFFPNQANGSLITVGTQVVGSSLIAQGFTEPKYFWPRPSAIKYDSASSGATNQSVSSADLLKEVNERTSHGATLEMRFCSASGLDPDISPESAQSQLERVSNARKLNQEQKEELKTLLTQHITPRQIGLLGEPRVNVLELNLAVEKHFGGKK